VYAVSMLCVCDSEEHERGVHACYYDVAEPLKLQKSSQFPDEPAKIKGAQIHYGNAQTY